MSLNYILASSNKPITRKIPEVIAMFKFLFSPLVALILSLDKQHNTNGKIGNIYLAWYPSICNALTGVNYKYNITLVIPKGNKNPNINIILSFILKL